MRRDTLERLRLLAVLAGLACAMGCGATRSGFRVPGPEVRDLVGVVAIARPVVPYDVDAIGDLRTHLERSLIRSFESAGLRVVGSAEWEAAWRRSAADVGGVYDANTGEVDESKYEIVRQAVRRDLFTEHGVDAIAHLSIESEEHYGTSREVAACGRWVPVFWPGGWRGGKTTLVRVACLKIVIVDRAGRALYGLRTPLEVTETFGHQTRAVRGPAGLFRDRDELADALGRIVDPFVENERD